jgi:16S rRNA processing protein RimM
LTLLLVGRVLRAHGLRGEVTVDVLSSEPDRRLAAGTELLAGDGRALRVVAARPHQGRWLVTFEGVHDRSAADGLRGTELRAEAIDDPDALWVHELVGATVVDTAGVPCGTVTGVLANPADDILELDGGGLVPVTFVVGWDDARRLVIDPPAGLLEL